MKQKLNCGHIILHDKEDERLVFIWSWQLEQQKDSWFVKRVRNETEDNVRGSIYLHRTIYEAAHGPIAENMIVSLIEKATFKQSDLRKSNLILVDGVTKARKHSKWVNVETTSKYKCVHWRTRDQVWCAQVRIDGQRYRIGYFHDEEEAARAVDLKTLEIKNDKTTWLNFEHLRNQYLTELGLDS